MLPDGVTYMKGYVKYPDQARRYLSLMDGGGLPEEDMNHPEIAEQPEDRKRVDLTKNVIVGISFRVTFVHIYVSDFDFSLSLCPL